MPGNALSSVVLSGNKTDMVYIHACAEYIVRPF